MFNAVQTVRMKVRVTDYKDHIGIRSFFTLFGSGRNIPVFPVCESSLPLRLHTEEKAAIRGKAEVTRVFISQN